jgi:hypothetical protein
MQTKMNKKLAVILSAIGTLSLAMQAGAYSENFSATAFEGSQLNLSGDPVGNVSERWGSDTAYYNINNEDGWTFTTGTYLAVNTAVPGGQAVLLNENAAGGSASTTIGGLVANAWYTLSFNYSGDNRPTTYDPSASYGFIVDANNVTATVTGLNWATVDPAGHVETLGVRANASGDVVLDISQTASVIGASPIITDVTLNVPDGGLTAGLLGGALIGIGALRRKLAI